MIQHVHGGGEQDALIVLTGAPGQDLSQKSFSNAGITNDDDAGAIAEELEIHKTKDAILHLQTALVMIELEAIDGVADAKMSKTEPAFNGARIPGFQLTVNERLQSGR